MKTLEQLYHQYYKPSKQPFFQNIIDESHQLLISNLSKADRKLILRIIDSKDSILGYHTKESFIYGFNLAVELLTELKQYNQGDYISEITEMQSPFAMEEKEWEIQKKQDC